MFSIFKPKEQRLVIALLQNFNFYDKHIIDFRFDQIASILIRKELLKPFGIVIRNSKVTHSMLLKTTMIILRLLQFSSHMQESNELETLLDDLELKAESKMHSSSSHLKKETCCTVVSVRQFHVDQDQIYANPQNHLIGRVVLPLISLEKRIIHCYDMLYKTKTEMNMDSCWASINLLLRFTQIGKTLEVISRYFDDEYFTAVVLAIKVLNTDIHFLYRRTRDYLNNEIKQLYEHINKEELRELHKETEEKVNQIMQIVEEMEIVNENLRIIYATKHLAYTLIESEIYMPRLFIGQHEVDFLYSVIHCKQTHKQKHPSPPHSSKQSTTAQLQSI